MGFKMKQPSTPPGTLRHKKEIQLNRSMDNTSLPDGRAGSSPFQQNEFDFKKKTKDYTSPEAAAYKREKQITKEHNTEAERGNPTGNTCMTCGEPKSKHVNNWPHAFKAYKPKKSPAKQLEKKPVGPRVAKKEEKMQSKPTVNYTQEYMKGGSKGVRGRAAIEKGTGGPNPEQKETTRLQQEYRSKKSPAKQAIGGGAGEAIDHWKKYKSAKAQDAAVDKLATNKNISRKAFDTKLAKITKTVDPHKKSLATKAKGPGQGKLGKVVTKVAKKGVKRVASRLAGPIAGLASAAYGAYKSGKKHSGGKAGSKEGQAKWKAQKEKAGKSDICGKNK